MSFSATMRNLGSVVAGVLLLAVCMPLSAMSQAAPPQGEEAWAYIAKLSKDERKAVLEKEAAREGSFTLYGQMGIDRAEHLVKAWSTRYPNIKLNFVRQTQAEQS